MADVAKKREVEKAEFVVTANMVVLRTGRGKNDVLRLHRDQHFIAPVRQRGVRTLLASKGIALASENPKRSTVAIVARAQGGIDDPVKLPDTDVLPIPASGEQVAASV